MHTFIILKGGDGIGRTPPVKNPIYRVGGHTQGSESLLGL